MNIGFDLTAVLGPTGKNRGIGGYTLAEFRELIRQDTENQYFAFNFVEEAPVAELFGNPPNLHVEFLWTGNRRELLHGNSAGKIFGNLVRSFLKTNRINLYYVTSPFDEEFPVYEAEWFEGVRVVATVYDIIPYIMKEAYLTTDELMERYRRRVDSLRFMDRLAVISQSVKTDLVREFSFPPEQISVIWGAADPRFAEKRYTEEEKRQLFEKFGIAGRYLMCTGGDDPRKNIEGLIRSYARLERDLREKYQLVIVCRLSPRSEERYHDVTQSLRLDGRVVFTGFVTDAELVELYNLADLMVFPSKYEGFGLPVTEAFACGTPVVTSNNSSLVEIAGDAAVTVDPFSGKDITRGIRQALVEEDPAQMAEKGRKRLEIFRWPAVAERVRQIFRELADAAPEPATALDASACGQKKKLAMFTPLPPLPSGISDYSVLLLSELKRYYDIDVYIDDSYRPDCTPGAGIRILNHREFEKHCGEYADVVYQMGNSDFHFYMYGYLWKYSGTVVLHDYNLHGAFFDYTVRVRKDYALYREFLLADYEDSETGAYFETVKNGGLPGIYDLRLNGKIVDAARKVIVHSDWSKERLLLRDIGRCVRKIQLGAEIGPLPDRNRFRGKYGFAEDDFILAAFGQIHTTKRNLQTLKAFRRVCGRHPDRKLKYVCAGKLDQSIEKQFADYVRENGLSGQVVVTGFISIEAFEEYIDLSDICLNLRYPYQGENSGSLVRLLAKAKPVIVNDIGSFGEIPDDACVKIPSVATLMEEDEVSEIERAMESLVMDADYREKLGKNARKFAEEVLDVKQVARNYRDFIEMKRYSVLDEKLLSEIQKMDLDLDSGRLRQLSHTLAYMKEA